MDKILFAAFGDVHLGRVWSAHTVPAKRELLTERYEWPVREAIQNYARRNIPLACAGDWFDKAHNSERQIQRSNEMLADMSIVIAGNHDHVNRESALTSMQLLHGLNQHNGDTITISPDHLNETCVNAQQFGSCWFYTVPHHATQALFESALIEAQAHAHGEKGPKVIMLHANVGAIGGGKADSNLYLTPQLAKMLEQDFDFILVGHEHLPRQMGKVVVLGSTQPCSFGELGPRFFYEFGMADGKLVMHKQPITTALTHQVIQVVAGQELKISDGAELVDLKGHVPMSMAKPVQRFVKDLYERGALAIRVDLTFDAGVTLDGDAVSGSMRNLIDVIRYEISDNPEWTAMLDESLAEMNEEKV